MRCAKILVASMLLCGAVAANADTKTVRVKLVKVISMKMVEMTRIKMVRVKLVKIGHEVLWILPWNDNGRFCGNYKLDDDTKKVICIETFCDL